MFLYLINEKQKNLFLKLALKAAEANGVVELQEKNMLKAFSKEMGIKPIYETGESTEDIIAELKKISDEKTKKIITFEILGIMISDSEYDTREREFVDKLTKAFSITDSQKNQMLKLIKDYVEIYNRISNQVLG